MSAAENDSDNDNESDADEEPVRRPLVILGLGNVLCEDDGAGVEALRQLSLQWIAPDGVDLVDGGTLGLSLLPLVEDADALVLVDAVDADAPAGTLVTLEGDQVPRAALERLSPHQVGVADLLHGAMWLDRVPARLVLVGVVPERVGLGVELSAPVAAAIPALVERVVETVRAMGFALERRELARARA